MLVTKSTKISEQDIVVVKLLSGEEVVGKVVEVTGEVVTLSKPISLMVAQDPSGRMITAFHPFMVGSDDDIRLRLEPSKFLAMSRARREIESEYVRSTTGLEMAPKGLDLNNAKLR